VSLNNRTKLQSITTETLVMAGAIIFVLPIILLFITSFKPESEIIHFKNVLPNDWTVANYAEVLDNVEEIPMARWFFNSVFVSSMITALVLFVDSLAAYALARLNLPGGKYVLILIIASLMIPLQMLLVPVYLILNWLGWLDTYLALIIPAASGAFGVFLLHQFFKSIPKEYEEAAAIDGCSKWGIYWRIILPMSKPALATLGIFVFVGSWNDFLNPLVFLDSVDKYTLPVGIALFQTSYVIEYGITLAASAIATLPVLIIFLLFQKHIIEGISLTGLKG